MMLYAFSVFVIVFLLMGSGLLLVFYREILGQRISGILAADDESGPRLKSKLRGAAESLTGIAGSIQKIVPKSETDVSAIRKRLVRAGFRNESAVNILYALKGLVPMTACVVATATGAYQWSPLIVLGGSIVIGYLLPDYVLDQLIKSRAEQIRAGLPDVLDLLVVCLEAGLSLDQSVLRATDELRPSYPVIVDEFSLVMLEVRAGRSRSEAWRSLAERTDVDVIRLLVSILVQADQFGTGISKTMRIHSETMRTRRKQRIEEAAAKTTVKLIFPLLLFIFPSVWVVVLGPAAITISENLK
jgi:tight adherence protein C